MRIITLVLSFRQEPWDYIEDEGIRKTWAKDAEDVLYYYGGSFPGVGEGAFSHREGDRLFFNIPEGSENIALKTKAAFEYLLENEQFDYIYRTNTSSYINMGLMRKVGEALHLARAPYAGVPKKGKCYYNAEREHLIYASGSGYFLSREAVSAITHNQEQTWGEGRPDDVTVGVLARGHRLPLTALNRYDCVGFDGSVDYEELGLACEDVYHFRCKNTKGNRKRDVDLMHRIHGQISPRNMKLSIPTNFGHDQASVEDFCFLVAPKYNGPYPVWRRWAELSDILERQGKSVLRTTRPGVNQFGFTTLMDSLRDLREFDTIVITYTFPEMHALTQYLIRMGKKVILDVTDTNYDFAPYRSMLPKFSSVISGNSPVASNLFGLDGINSTYVATPVPGLSMTPVSKEDWCIRVLFLGTDLEAYRMENIMKYVPSNNFQLLRMTDGEYRTHAADPELFMRLKVDAILLDDTPSLPIPEAYLFAKGVPVLAARGPNSIRLLRGSGKLCHSDDEWQRALMDLLRPVQRASAGSDMRAVYESGRFSGVLATKVLRDIPATNPFIPDGYGNRPKINMLVRTSSRQAYYTRLMDCLTDQCYPDLNIIVSVDNDSTQVYVDGDGRANKVVRVTPGEGTHFYNGYMNTLLAEVEEGWVFFMDDDDVLFDNHTLNDMAKVLEGRDKLHVFQMVNEQKNRAVIPAWDLGTKVIEIGKIGTPCFVMDASIAKKGHWPSCAAADGHYITGLASKYFPEEKVVRHPLVTVRLPQGAGRGSF